MNGNSVSPMPELAPIAEFDKTPVTPPPEEGIQMEDLPPPIHNDLAKKDSRQYERNEDMGCLNWCEYVLILIISSILLIGALVLTLYWTIYYRKGFGWSDKPQLQFNLHPVLMIAGFITLSGFSVLLYRICRCWERLHVKLFHMGLHALAIPCIIVGFIAVYDYHNLNSPPIPNLYSLHSWIGLATMGSFAFQFLFGSFCFLVLLCCENKTLTFRAAMVPLHATFGLITFILAVITCLTGLTEKAIFQLGSLYSTWLDEGIVINVLGMILVTLVILITFAIRPNCLRI